jgi:hypothetical protein
MFTSSAVELDSALSRPAFFSSASLSRAAFF